MSIKKKQLKSGTKYAFRLRYTDIFGNVKEYTSKGYDTKREAELEEAKFRIKVNEGKVSSTNLTFNQVFLEYIEYKSKDIKPQSLNKVKVLKHANQYNPCTPRMASPQTLMRLQAMSPPLILLLFL